MTDDQTSGTTAYVVLLQIPTAPAPEPTGPADAAERSTAERWEVVEVVRDATGSDQAIRKAAAAFLANAEGDDAEFVFVAAPLRSWKPVTVTAERTLKLNLA